MRLFDLYAPVFSAGLKVRESIHRGANRTRPVDDVQRELNQLLDSIEQQARSAGKREPDIKASTFALVGWLDEVVAGDPEWFGFDARPIQVLRFDTYQAGEEFYSRLMELRPEQDEVREVYFTALCLGFLGKYALEPESAELKALTASQGRQLPIRPVNPASIAEERLTPQPYGVALPTQRRLPSSRGRWFMWAAILLAIAVPLGVYVYFLMNAPQPRPPEGKEPIDVREEPPPPPPPPPANRLTDAEILKKVTEVIGSATCAHLRARVSEGHVTLDGFESSDESRRGTKAQLLALEGVGSVNTDAVGLIPKPMCEVAQALAPYATEPDLPLALEGGKLAAAMGEAVVVKTQAARAFDGFVYVDIYSPDGGVGHMLPEEHAPVRKTPAGSPIVAGAGDPLAGSPRWTVEPPGGPHLLVVMTSPIPLFAKPRPLGEDFHEYLQALQPALKAGPSGGSSPVVRFVVLHLGQ